MGIIGDRNQKGRIPMEDQDFVAYGLPLIEEDDIAGVLDSLRSGWLTRGPKTMAFEKAFAE
jgi:dTDP-4-amino-4,6-dideoxygalactose transaminase